MPDKGTTRYQNFLTKLSSLGAIAPFLFFIGAALIIFFLFRIGLSIFYFNRVTQEPHYWYMYFIGIRMDMIIISYLLFLPFAFFFLLPKTINRRLTFFWICYFTLFIDIIFFMEMATMPFLKEYDLRPDSIFVKYLGNVKEVAGTIWKADGLELVITFVLLFFLHLFIWRSFKKLVKDYRPYKWQPRLLYFILGVGILGVCARSSFTKRPANISTAYFSDKNKLVNELTLNSTYSVFYAVLRLSKEKDPSAVYGKMPNDEMFARVKNKLLIADSQFIKIRHTPFYIRRYPLCKRHDH